MNQKLKLGNKGEERVGGEGKKRKKLFASFLIHKHTKRKENKAGPVISSTTCQFD